MAKILLIDDDQQVRAVIEGFLKHNQHEVISVENGKQGLIQLKMQQFDLIITDIIMPEQDGFETIMAVATMPDAPKIIAISGGSTAIKQDMLLSVASKMPISNALAKPVSYEQLTDAVNKALA
jgi:CheY-like chemotaxis protein